MPIDVTCFLEVEDTNQIMERFVAALHAADDGITQRAPHIAYRSWTGSERPLPQLISERLREIGRAWEGQLVLFLPKQDLTGAVELPGSVMLTHIPKLHEAMSKIWGTRFDLRLATRDAASGLSWELNYSDQHHGDYYCDGTWELISWGRLGEGAIFGDSTQG